jgi:hypothetical protein
MRQQPAQIWVTQHKISFRLIDTPQPFGTKTIEIRLSLPFVLALRDRWKRGNVTVVEEPLPVSDPTVAIAVLDVAPRSVPWARSPYELAALHHKIDVSQ